VSEVDLAHPTGSELRDDAIRAEALAEQGIAFGVSDEGSGLFESGRLEEAFCIIRSEQGLDFLTQVVITLAGRVKESGALLRLTLKRLLNQTVYFLPSFRRHIAVVSGRWSVVGNEHLAVVDTISLFI
jgi:hypothetical protein